MIRSIYQLLKMLTYCFIIIFEKWIKKKLCESYAIEFLAIDISKWFPVLFTGNNVSENRFI